MTKNKDDLDAAGVTTDEQKDKAEKKPWIYPELGAVQRVRTSGSVLCFSPEADEADDSR